jgi:hypothetical protein
MSNALALPDIAAKGLVPNHDLSIVRRLRSSWNVRLRTSWMGSSNQSLTCLEIEGEPTKDELAGALNDLDADNRTAATPTQIAKGLAVLTAVCAKPADFDDAKVVLWSERLKQVLQEYPSHIALAMISEWPKTDSGKWWPTENEIRSCCERALTVRRALRSEIERAMSAPTAIESNYTVAPLDDGLSDQPSGKTDIFVSRLWQRDPSAASAYLHNARYDDVRIGVRYPVAEFALRSRAADLIAELGVRIVNPIAVNEAGVAEWPQ